MIQFGEPATDAGSLELPFLTSMTTFGTSSAFENGCLHRSTILSRSGLNFKPACPRGLKTEFLRLLAQLASLNLLSGSGM